DGSSRATGLVALTLLQRAEAFAAGPGAASVPEDESVDAVIAAITDTVTGGTDSEGRTDVVGTLCVGEDVAKIRRREQD
ncbi:MAG: hypothetical protein ACTIJR_12525, partial [Brevibacterium linens]